jgi:hypothetical protein
MSHAHRQAAGLAQGGPQSRRSAARSRVRRDGSVARIDPHQIVHVVRWAENVKHPSLIAPTREMLEKIKSA